VFRILVAAEVRVVVEAGREMLTEQGIHPCTGIDGIFVRSFTTRG
jgi:hypothetical protein